MKRLIVVIAAAAGVTAIVLPAAAASATPQSGPEKVWVTPSPTGTSVKRPGKVMLTGSVADYGRSVSTTASGKPTKHGTYVLLTLKKGSILVNVSQFNAAAKSAQPETFNKTSCSAEIHISGPATLVRGTKAYVGIGGTFTMTATFAFIGPLTKSGACTTKTTTPALSTYGAITGSGTVSFSS
jgi:hypothetical protein